MTNAAPVPQASEPRGSKTGSARATVTILPGRRLVAGTVILAVVALPAFVWPWWGWLVTALGVALAASAIADGRAAADAVRGLRVGRRLPAIAGRGLEFTSVVTVEGNGPRPTRVTVRDVHPAACLPEWSEARPSLVTASDGTFRGVVHTPCRIPERGDQSFGPVWVRVEGPLRLVDAQRETPCPGPMSILPETFASREELVKENGAAILLLDRTLRSRELGAGTEFVSLLPFRDGDDPRRIDWRATARHRSPVVRRFQVERHRDVVIAIDRGRLMGATADGGTKLDRSVDAALNLARVVLHGGDRCGLIAFDDRVRCYHAPITGPQALSRLVEIAAGLSCDFRETDYLALFAEMQRRLSKRCLLVVLTDVGDLEASRTQVSALARLGRRHLVLLAALRTPLLGRVVREPPEDLAAGARKAVAHGLLRDRSRALAALERDGIRVLDVEPGALTLPLVNRFIELRGRNLL